jgi:hypothetical protein
MYTSNKDTGSQIGGFLGAVIEEMKLKPRVRLLSIAVIVLRSRLHGPLPEWYPLILPGRLGSENSPSPHHLGINLGDEAGLRELSPKPSQARSTRDESVLTRR